MNRRMKRNRDSVVVLLLIMFLMLGVNVSGLKVNAETWGDYEYEVLEDGTVSITGYTEKDSVLEIPDTIDNKKVTSIEKRAFYWCDGITSIVIPESVTSIGDWAFLRCSGLTSVTIPESVMSIGDGAFCICSSLTSVTIPESVMSIGDGAFAQCGGLMSISVGENNQNYCSEDGVLLKKDKSELLCHPAGKTGIYIIPNSVTSIGIDAFAGCSGLTSITIPDSVTSIDYYAFNDCSSLTSVIIPNSVTSIAGGAFAGCSSLTSIVIPEGVTSIGYDTFYGCSGLTSVTIPDSVTSIDDYAFSGCSGLKSVTIPNSVTSIGDGVFDYCDNVTLIVEKGSYAEQYAKDNDISYQYMEIKNPDNTTEEPTTEQPTPADYGDFLDIENSSVSVKTAKPGDTITWSFKIKEGYQVTNANLYLQFPNHSGKSIYNTTIRDNGDYVDISYIVPEIGQNGTYHVSLFQMRNGDKGWLWADDGAYDFQPLDVTISGMQEDNTPPDVNFDEIRVSISDKKFKIYIPAKDDLSGVDEVGGIFYIFNKDMNEWESLNFGWSWSFSISPGEWTVLPDGYVVERNLDDFMQTAEKIIGREVVSTDIFAINYIRIWDVARNVAEDYIHDEVTGIDGLPSYLRFTMGGEDKDITDEKPSEGSMPENPVTPPVQDLPVTTPTGSTPAAGSILIVTKDQCRVKVLSADNENPTVAYIGTTNKKASKLKVPDTVTVDNITYKVVSIEANAFKNNKKLNSITIGKNIKTIGKNAFSGCKNLKKVTIKSTVLKSVGKNAIKGIHKKAVIKCPKKQLKQYKKLFKKSTGYKSSMKIKK